MAQEIDGSRQTLHAAIADGSEPARSAASFGLPTTILVPAETKIVTTTCTEVVPISSDSQAAILGVAAGDEAGHSWLLLTVTATTNEEGSDIDWTEALAGNGFRVDQFRDTLYGATNAPDGFVGSGQLIPLWDVIAASWQRGRQLVGLPLSADRSGRPLRRKEDPRMASSTRTPGSAIAHATVAFGCLVGGGGLFLGRHLHGLA